MKKRLFILLACSVPALFAGKNIILNGSFEDMTTKCQPKHWFVPKDATIASDATDGKGSISFNGAVSQWGIPLHPGQYLLRFKVKKDNSKWLGIRLFCRSKDGKEIRSKKLSGYFGTKGPFPEWTTIEFLAEVPEDVQGAGGLIFSSHGGLMLIDDVQLTRVEADKTDGELVFQDNFERKELGKDWIAESGEWEIENGTLHAKAAPGFNLLKFARPLGKNLRLEYTCYSRNPQDLSAILAAHQDKKGLNGYVFGFAASYNSYNYIASTAPFTIMERTMQEGFNTGAIPDKKHRIIVEKREGTLKFFRDGKLELTTDDIFAEDKTGKSFGLFSYHTAYFDDIKVYRLPESKTIARKPEYPVKEIIFLDKFECPEDFAGGKAEKVLVPTWEYEKTKDKTQYIVQDPCLQISDVSLKLPKTENGIVEFDILAGELKEITVDLVDAAGNTAGSFIIDDKGMFHAWGDNGKVPLLNKIEYRRRLIYDTLAIDPRKWYTFRIKYDSQNKLIDNIALIEYYTENQGGYSASQPIKQGDYVSLGGRIAMKNGAGKPVAVRFKTPKGKFHIDNYLAFGPVGFKSVKGKSLLLSGTKLLNLTHQKRRDPMLLKVQSLRNLDNHNIYRTPVHMAYGQGMGKTNFQDWARKYNELLINMAFLKECIEILERKDFYQGKMSLREELRKEFAQAEQLQEKALKAFADAFWDKISDDLLKNQAEPELKKFEAAYTALRKKLNRLDPSLKKIPAAPVYHKWDLKYNPDLKLWTNNGKPEAFISSVSQVGEGSTTHASREYLMDKVRAMGLQPASASINGVTGGAPKNGEYFDYSRLDRSIKHSIIQTQEHKLPGYCLSWLQLGTGQMRTSVPKWWFDKYKSDTDIFFALPDGTPGNNATPIYWGWPKAPFLALNFWNKNVQDFISTKYRILGEKLSKHRKIYDNTIFYLGGEASITLPGGMYAGYARSSVKAFQKRLEKKYGTIENLNKKWETGYKSFESIKPPPPAAEPSPLRYEFNTFVHEDYFNVYLRLAKDNLEKGYGRKMPIGHDMQTTFSEFDMPAYFDNVSMALFHTYQIWDRKIYPKYLRSLSEATGTPWSAIEWGPSQGSRTMFDLEEHKAHGLQEICHQLMSGCIAPNIFADVLFSGTSDWQYGFIPTDHRTGFLTFNYHASSFRIGKDRGMRFGEAALMGKTITPDIAVLEVDSSRRNALPDMSVYTMCKDFSMEMEKISAHYGFLFEKLVIDGRQKINDIPVIFVPNGIVMNNALDKKLEEYLRNGGTVIAFAPPGVYNEFGKRKTGGLLSKTFPGVKWSHKNYTRWFADGKTQQLWTAKLGKGTLYIFPEPSNYEGNKAQFATFMKKHIDPKITCSKNNFQYSYLEYKGKRFLYLLNSSLDKTSTAELSLSGKYDISDIGMPEKQKVSAVYKDGRTWFKIRLAPAGMTLLEITK